MSQHKSQLIKKLIQESSKIAISGHVDADLDSICSTLAMYEICEQIFSRMNKEFEILPLIWEQNDLLKLQLPNADKLRVCDRYTLDTDSNLNDINLLILLDLGEFSRSPITKLIGQNNTKVVVIDHHINSCLSDLDKVDVIINYIARSTASMLFREFFEFDTELLLSKSLAQNLLAGIYGDTDYLTDVNITSSDFRMIANLMDAGADLDMLVINVNRSLSIDKIKAVSSGLQEVKIQKNFAFCVLDYVNLNKIAQQTSYMLNKHDILDEIRRIDGVDFAIVIFEPKLGFLTASLKSRTEKMDLEAIARHFGGGGHKIASAFRFETDDFTKSVSEILRFLSRKS